MKLKSHTLKLHQTPMNARDACLVKPKKRKIKERENLAGPTDIAYSGYCPPVDHLATPINRRASSFIRDSNVIITT